MINKKTLDLLKVGDLLLKVDAIKLATKPMNCGMEMADVMKEVKQELAEEMIKIFKEESTFDCVCSTNKPSIDEEMLNKLEQDIKRLNNKVVTIETEIVYQDDVEKFLNKELMKLNVAKPSKPATTRKKTTSNK